MPSAAREALEIERRIPARLSGMRFREVNRKTSDELEDSQQIVDQAVASA